MNHEKMMEKAWRFIADMGISENRKEADYYVENVHQVRDAYYADLESGYYREGEDVVGFLNRHCIEWEQHKTNILYALTKE